MTCAQVNDTLGYLGRDSAAIVVAPDGQLWLAFNIGDEVYYCDPRTGLRYHDSPVGVGIEETVDVGYLDCRGNSFVPLGDYRSSFAVLQGWDPGGLASPISIAAVIQNIEDDPQLANTRSIVNRVLLSAMQVILSRARPPPTRTSGHTAPSFRRT